MSTENCICPYKGNNKSIMASSYKTMWPDLSNFDSFWVQGLYKSSLNIWLLLGYFGNIAFLNKNYSGCILGNYWQHLGYFCSNIWSQCCILFFLPAPKNENECFTAMGTGQAQPTYSNAKRRALSNQTVSLDNWGINHIITFESSACRNT